MFANRSVVEIMVLIFVMVVAFLIVAIGAFVAIVEIRDPTADTDRAVEGLFGAISVITGALLGLLAGKSESAALSQRPEPKE